MLRWFPSSSLGTDFLEAPASSLFWVVVTNLSYLAICVTLSMEAVMQRIFLISLIVVSMAFPWFIIAAPIPDTGQTTCYDNTKEIACPSPGERYYGQDGNYSINPMSYTNLDDKGQALPDSATSWTMVKDNVTGLFWEMKTNKDGVTNYNDPHDADNVYTWYDSNPSTNGGNAGTPGDGTDTEDFIKSLNELHYGGYCDWRLPTIKELANIVDYSIPEPGPAINPKYFPNTAASWYWTATPYAYDPRQAWLMYFEYSNDHNDDKGKQYYARAVRGEKTETSVAEGYIDNGDGTITDRSTGLMWQKADVAYSFTTWEYALAYCEGLSLAGYTDWRLPTIKELRSIVDYSRYDPSIDTSFFSYTPPAYWSSTSSIRIFDAWLIFFNYGFDYDLDNFITYPFRAVRGGQGKCTPIIKANGVHHEITVKSGNNVSVSVSLEAGEKTGYPADWWFAIDSPWGWFFLMTSGLTQSPMPLYQSSRLYDFYDHKIIEGPLPVGDYKFYFAVYMTPNDSTNSPLYIDSVSVHVVNQL